MGVMECVDRNMIHGLMDLCITKQSVCSKVIIAFILS